MLIVSVVGTRPNFVKEFLINAEFKSKRIREVLVHTGQHYDYEMSKIFFEDFNLPIPDYQLDTRGKTNIERTTLMMKFIEEVLLKEKPNAVLVYGDVNSTLAASIVSAKLEIPVIHIEGGIRTKQLYNPEEINRRVTDCLSKLIFTATRTDYNNLLKENYKRNRICFSGDLMKDTILRVVEQNKIIIDKNDYLVCTIHRQENVESKKRLSNIVTGLIKSDKRIIFPAHPRTISRLEKYSLINEIKNSNIEIIPPQSYREFVKLLAGASKVLTDSGGVRREAYILGKPVILLINLIWFPEIHKAKWAYVADDDSDKIAFSINNFIPPSIKPEIFGDGNAHKKIIDRILLFLQTEKSNIEDEY